MNVLRFENESFGLNEVLCWLVQFGSVAVFRSHTSDKLLSVKGKKLFSVKASTQKLKEKFQNMHKILVKLRSSATCADTK